MVLFDGVCEHAHELQEMVQGSRKSSRARKGPETYNEAKLEVLVHEREASMILRNLALHQVACWTEF